MFTISAGPRLTATTCLAAGDFRRIALAMGVVPTPVLRRDTTATLVVGAAFAANPSAGNAVANLVGPQGEIIQGIGDIIFSSQVLSTQFTCVGVRGQRAYYAAREKIEALHFPAGIKLPAESMSDGHLLCLPHEGTSGRVLAVSTMMFDHMFEPVPSP